MHQAESHRSHSQINPEPARSAYRCSSPFHTATSLCNRSPRACSKFITRSRDPGPSSSSCPYSPKCVEKLFGTYPAVTRDRSCLVGGLARSEPQQDMLWLEGRAREGAQEGAQSPWWGRGFGG